jgi:integrase
MIDCRIYFFEMTDENKKLDHQQPQRAPRNHAGTILRKKKKVKVKKTAKNPSGEKEVVELYARLRRDGREKKRRIFSESEAPRVWRELETEFADDRRRELEAANADNKTFADLLDYFEANLLKEAVWRDGRVVEGYRTPVKHIQQKLDQLRAEFGLSLLSDITYEDLRRFREKLLGKQVIVRYKEKVPIDKSTRAAKSRRQFETKWRERVSDRKVATVNRVLAWARRLLNVAIELGWRETNPFEYLRKGKKPLIVTSAENERMRILSQKEEEALIRAASEPTREHLRPILICALDTALRHGEMNRLKWKDVDFEQNVIYAEAEITKILKLRLVPVSKRLRVELKKLWLQSGQNEEADVFLIKDCKRSFATACRIAGIKDFRFHDLRHTATTRLSGILKDTAKTMKITGHTTMKTFLRYTNVDAEIAREAGILLDAAHEAASRKSIQSENSAPADAPIVVSLEDKRIKKAVGEN